MGRRSIFVERGDKLEDTRKVETENIANRDEFDGVADASVYSRQRGHSGPWKKS